MFYKEEASGNWISGVQFILPDGHTIDVDNRENDYGFEWNDTPPTAYTEWYNNSIQIEE